MAVASSRTTLVCGSCAASPWVAFAEGVGAYMGVQGLGGGEYDASLQRTVTRRLRHLGGTEIILSSKYAILAHFSSWPNK
jgi:hypothetical protein